MLNEGLLLAPLVPCGTVLPLNSGEQTAAEWARIVFHDFVTANVAAGTGYVICIDILGKEYKVDQW